MTAMEQWLNEKLKKSAHAALQIAPPPAIAGAGERILLAAGPTPTKVCYVALRHGGSTIRVGFAAKDRWANEEIEEAVESNGGTMTEFLEDAMEADDALEFPVQHFHEAGWFHFACDLSRDAAFFASSEGQVRVWYYFDGYCRAVLPLVSEES